MAKSYVKFEVTKEVAEKTLEAIRLAKQSGTVRKGVNEVTKSVERGLASFVVMAEDIDPEEIVMHIPMLCDQRKIAYSYVPTKMELGKAIGMNIPCSSVAIERAGEGEAAIKEIVGRVSGKAAQESREVKAEHKREKETGKAKATVPDK